MSSEAPRSEVTPEGWGRLHVVLPLRTLSGGKARLGGALDAEEREALILGMARRTIRVLRAWPACERITLVSPDADLIAALAGKTGGDPEPTVRALFQADEGLNEAIEQARAEALAAGASSLLVLPGDLPELSTEALDRLLLAADAALAANHGGTLVAIAPSDARAGTNALLLRPPDVIDPAFGPDSLEAHLRAAAAGGAAVQVVRDIDLAFDLDTPDDLERLDPARLRELMDLGLEGRSVSAHEGPRLMSDRILSVALPQLPEVRPGDDLADLVVAAWRQLATGEPDLAARDGDVLVVTQKVVSKAEGRIVRLADVTPRPEAVAFARRWDRDARQVEVVLRESADVLRMERGIIISRTHHGFVCANAGVDASNVGEEGVLTLLPADPDASAAALRTRVAADLGVAVGIVISDSFGRPWRWGIVDVALGVAGFGPLDDLRGRVDTEGRLMHATVVAVADEIASAAELASGKTSRRPVVLVRGVRLPAGPGSVVGDVLMPPENDLFT
ncbi:hypothetical protein BH23CHL8_BH23CHL8_15880 [soil metagenome]